MEDKKTVLKFLEKFTTDEAAIKRIPKYFFLIVVLLIVIAIELHHTNEKLDIIIDNNTEEKKQMVVEIFSEEEKTPADYMPILDTVTEEESTETTTETTTKKTNSSGNNSTENTTKKAETTTKSTSNEQTQPNTNSRKIEYILNINSKKIHLPDCSSAARTKDENKKTVYLTADELKEYLNDGYEYCKICGGN